MNKIRYKDQGSEKIQNLDEKVSRIAELSGINKKNSNKSNKPTTSSTGRLSNILYEVEARNGKEFAIVQEQKYVYLKEKVNGEYDYIDGVRNLKENSYPNYASAMKGLNLKLQQINESLEAGETPLLGDKKKRLT